MDSLQFLCFSCGNRFTVASCGCSSENKEKGKCPHCSSENVLLLNPANPFGVAGGG